MAGVIVGPPGGRPGAIGKFPGSKGAYGTGASTWTTQPPIGGTSGGGSSAAMQQYLRDQAMTRARQAAENMAGSASATVTAPGGGSVPGAPGVGTVPAPGAPSGTNAAMLRAKERAGELARSSVSGLRAVLGERGMLGSGVEGRATTNIATEALKQVSDVNREQAIKEADQAARFAELGYQGAITQRGQDITMRGQDIGAQQAAAGRAQSTYQTTLQAMLEALRAQLY